MCGVTKAAVSNWAKRGVNLVEPDAYMSSGSPLWTQEHAAEIARMYRKKSMQRIKQMEDRFAQAELFTIEVEDESLLR